MYNFFLVSIERVKSKYMVLLAQELTIRSHEALVYIRMYLSTIVSIVRC
jgi:hypothetical protein